MTRHDFIECRRVVFSNSQTVQFEYHTTNIVCHFINVYMTNPQSNWCMLFDCFICLITVIGVNHIVYVHHSNSTIYHPLIQSKGRMFDWFSRYSHQTIMVICDPHCKTRRQTISRRRQIEGLIINQIGQIAIMILKAAINGMTFMI